MRWKEYFIVMKNSGLSWLGHLLPFGVVVAFQMQFVSSPSTFNKKPCSYSRFGNSGLFLVFSQTTQDKLRESREKTDRWRREEDARNELEQLEKLKKKYGCLNSNSENKDVKQ